MVEVGKDYVHFKGGTYRVIAIANWHDELSSDEEKYVVYAPIKYQRPDMENVYVRPLSEFEEDVEVKNLLPRFKQLTSRVR